MKIAPIIIPNKESKGKKEEEFKKTDLMKEFEKETGKHAVWGGEITDQFKEWKEEKEQPKKKKVKKKKKKAKKPKKTKKKVKKPKKKHEPDLSFVTEGKKTIPKESYVKIIREPVKKSKPKPTRKDVEKTIKQFEEMVELEQRTPRFKRIKAEAAEWGKGPKPETKDLPKKKFDLEPTAEELELMEDMQSREREEELLKPTQEEEDIMKRLREPDLTRDIKPTEKELAYMEKEGLIDEEPADKLERTKTGIEGIDELTNGGLPRGKAIAVVGGPGTGKSIFLMQFLVNGANNYGEPGIYITFEEDVDELRSNFRGFKFNIKELERRGLLKIVHYSPMKIKRFINNMDVTLRDLIKEMKAKRIVIDSLSAFTLLFENEGEQREGLFELFQTLKGLGMTSLLSTESWREPTITKSGIIEFIADGVIMLYNLKMGDARVRAVEILKMRGIKHEARIVPFRITNKGIKIFPEEKVFGPKRGDDFSF
ncbi:AAA family ATPase [archaeon]|nr:AAA family ATPase [archaeon]